MPNNKMSRASLIKPMNIENKTEIEAEAKKSDYIFAKPETTVAKTSNRFVLSDEKFSVFDCFTVNHWHFKADHD